MTRRRLDTGALVPSDLVGLSDQEFQEVVNADLRRRVQPAGLSERVSAALRSDTHVRRWHATLLAMQRSVEGQLIAGQTDFEQAVTDLERRIRAASGRDRDRLEDELLATRSEHLQRRAKTERFKTGVDEHIEQASSLIASMRDEMLDSVVALERDRYARRMRTLERAIRDHREEVTADLDGEEPEEFDRRLWSHLDGSAGE